MTFSKEKFICPHCNRKLLIKDWIDRCIDEGYAVYDSGYTDREFRESGRIAVRYFGMQCECGAEYRIEACDDMIRVYDEEDRIAEEIEYRSG